MSFIVTAVADVNATTPDSVVVPERVVAPESVVEFAIEVVPAEPTLSAVMPDAPAIATA